MTDSQNGYDIRLNEVKSVEKTTWALLLLTLTLLIVILKAGLGFDFTCQFLDFNIFKWWHKAIFLFVLLIPFYWLLILILFHISKTEDIKYFERRYSEILNSNLPDNEKDKRYEKYYTKINALKKYYKSKSKQLAIIDILFILEYSLIFILK